MESTTGPEPVCLLLIGLSEDLARSLARYVSGDPRVALIGVAPSLALASMLAPRTQPDLALLDWATLSGSPPDAIRALRRNFPGLRIICVVNEAEPYVAPAARAGADAVVSKDRFAGELDYLLRLFFPERFGKAPDQNG